MAQSENQGGSSSIPVQSVDADQLPREKGLAYDEVCKIIGSLYLDSHHAVAIREEQFNAVSDEYQRRILALQAEVKQLTSQLSSAQRELEVRNEQ